MVTPYDSARVKAITNVLRAYILLVLCSVESAEPDPPRDLQIEVVSGKIVHLEWQAPLRGQISGYKLTIIPLSEQDEVKVYTFFQLRTCIEHLLSD